MRPIDEMPHLRVLFRRLDSPARAHLVQRIRESALLRLAGHLPEGFDSTNSDHLVVAALHIEKSHAAGAAKDAARLLRACVHAAENPHCFDFDMIADLYGLLDAPLVRVRVEHNRNASRRPRPGARSPMRDTILRTLAPLKREGVEFRTLMRRWRAERVGSLRLEDVGSGRFRVVDEDGEATDCQTYTRGTLERLYSESQRVLNASTG